MRSALWSSPVGTVGSLLTWSSYPGTVAPVIKNKALACVEVAKVPDTVFLDL